MGNNSDDKIIDSSDYKDWLISLKTKIRQVQLKALVAVNRELLWFYWQLGADLVNKQKKSSWGEGFLKHLSQDLMAEFPEIKGFSQTNLKLIRQWYQFYSSNISLSEINNTQPNSLISQQAVDQIKENQNFSIFNIPWGHNIAIVSKCQTIDEALFYVNNTVNHNWSRSVLIHQIESGLWFREGKAISNFSRTLPTPQSDLAQQMIKDPYVFDFLTLSADYNERELESGLIEHITKFLLELGSGFAYLGRQVPIKVGERDFYLDLLFYHVRLHCYVVIELKTGEFEPEHAGKLNFYLKAVDELIKSKEDQPTIGILLCKNKDKLVAEYALSDIHKPIGVSEYQLTQSLPDNLKSSLPSVEEIEAEVSNYE